MKKKSGFVTVWVIGMLGILMYIITFNNNGANPYFWSKAVADQEMFYNHLITIENWAKRNILKDEPAVFSLKNNDKNVKVVARIGSEDGKINLNNLINIKSNKYRLVTITKIFKMLYGERLYKSVLGTAIELVEDGKMYAALDSLGERKEFFTVISNELDHTSNFGIYHQEEKLANSVFNPTRADDEMDGVPSFNDKYKININNSDIKLRRLLSEFWVEGLTDDVSGDFDNISDLKFIIKSDLLPIFKTTSLFYNVKGYIIIGETKRVFKIDLIGGRSFVKTIQRQLH